MNVAGLYKLLNRIVLREYKWIEKCEIDSSYDRPWETFTIVYYTDSVDIKNRKDEVKEIKDLTEDLFKVLGPERTQIFGGIEFRFGGWKLDD
jgi:hypothetical protein